MNQGTKLTKKLTFLFIFLIAFSVVAEIQVVKVATANPAPQPLFITIKGDGSIEPETGLIEKTGNVYSLTADLSRRYAVIIQRSNIVVDGAGHFIGRSIPSVDFGYGYQNIGLKIESVTNVTVRDIEVSGFSDRDVSIENSSRSVFLRVKAKSLQLWNSSFNIITESHIGDDDHSLLIRFSNFNTIMRNNITWVGLGGYTGSTFLGGLDGYSNILFENNFEGKPVFISVNGANFWDNGSIGNYWSGYKCTDGNGDGIGDMPYDITTKAQDRYPLTKPWDPTRPIDTVPPRISIDSPENKVYNSSSVPLVFSILESSSSMSYSLDGRDNVTITGNTTLSGLQNGSYNLTVYVTDSSGNIGASETIYFTVDKKPEPSQMVLIAGTVGISILFASVGLLYYYKKRTPSKT